MLAVAATLASCGLGRAPDPTMAESPEPPSSDQASVAQQTSETTESHPPEPDSLPEVATWPDTIEAVRSGVVMLEQDDCNGDLASAGTGFLVAPDLIVTAAHVVDGLGEVSAISGEMVYETELLGFDEVADVALLRTTAEMSGYVFGMIEDDPRLAEEVTVLGYPLWATTLNVTRGTISATGVELMRPDGVQWPVTQTDTAVNHGNSGGPLILIDGTVAGVVISFGLDQQEDARAEGVGYALSGTAVQELVEEWLVAGAVPPERDRCQAESSIFSPLTITVLSDSWHAGAVAALMERYASAINAGDWESAWALYSPTLQGRIGDYGAWVEGLWTSYWREIYVVDVHELADGSFDADVVFQTEQRSDLGPDGQECSNWAMTYTIRPDGDSFRIDAATLMDTDGPNPEAC